jgi:hypothetical protein
MFDRLAASEYSVIDQASQNGLSWLYLKNAFEQWLPDEAAAGASRTKPSTPLYHSQKQQEALI